jgi:hypothetical protein
MGTPSQAYGDYDLFFIYATVDDKERLPGSEETRWVTYFRKCLLTQSIGKSDAMIWSKYFRTGRNWHPQTRHLRQP